MQQLSVWLGSFPISHTSDMLSLPCVSVLAHQTRFGTHSKYSRFA